MITTDELIVNANSGYNQLLKIVESDIFVSKQYQLRPGESLVLEAEQAAFYATDQDIEQPYEYWTHILERQEIYYTDIRNSLDDKGKVVENVSHDLTMLLIKAAEIKIKEKQLPEFILDVICGNFEMFLYELTFDQSLAPFNANLLRIYSEGGFPCGWKGEYPKGEQLVYIHHS